MKILLAVTLCVFSIQVSNAQGGFNFSLPKIEGGTQNLSDFQNKRMMVITLPVLQTAETDSLLIALDSLAVVYDSTLKIIAVPSYEDGFLPANNEALTTWYRSRLSSRITISNGIYTRKTSGVQQHPFFKWLTHVQENEHFDYDVEGPGYKFFIKADGGLYGLLVPSTKLKSKAITKTLSM